MLDLMRRKKRLKAVLWVVIIGLGLGMVLFFVPGQNIGSGVPSAAVATVNGQPISVKEYWDAYRRLVRNMTASYNRDLDPAMLKALGIDRQALNALINIRVIEYAARRLGLDVAPQELRRAIETHPNLQDGSGFIGLERYKALLAANNIEVEEFEADMRMSVLAQKITQIVSDSLEVTEDEMRADFERTNQEAQVRYVLVKKEDFLKKVVLAEADIKAYFEANKDRYAIPEQRRARYLLISTSDIASAIQVTDEEVQARWASEGRQETVDASHILFKVDDAAKDAEVKAKAEDILKQIRAGADFGELAQLYSDDSGSSERGGNLGPFPRGRMVREFETVAFSLQPGQVSDLVRTQFGYHIIKVLQHETPDLKASWTEVARLVQMDKAAALVKQKVEQAPAVIEKEKSLPAIAKALGLAEAVAESNLLAQDSDPSAQGLSSAFVNELFALKEIDALGKPVDVPMGYAIPQLTEIRLAKPPDLGVSRAAVERDCTDAKAKELARAAAQGLKEAAARLGDLEKSARAAGLTVATSQSFKRDGTPAPEVSASTEFRDRSFDLAIGEISSPISIQGEDQLAVLQAISRTAFDEEAYKNQKQDVRQRLLSRYRDAYFQSFIQRLTDDLQKAGKIRIDAAVMEQVTGSGS